MHLYLIRHGQCVENTKDYSTGENWNSPLTEMGWSQARALAEWLPQKIRFDRLYASTMQRARQTVSVVAEATKQEPIWEDALREVGNARPDGTAFPDDALPLYHANVWGSRQPYSAMTVEGESWMHFRTRVGSFIERLIIDLPVNPDEHKDLIYGVVCHGGVIEAVFEHVFQKGPWSTVVVHTNNTGITHLEYRPLPGFPEWWLNFHNKTQHLTDEQMT